MKFSVSLFSAFLSVSLFAAPFGAYEEVAPAAIRPEGHLREFLRRQADGITGHPEKLGYPFNTGMWEGPIKRIVFTEGVYCGSDEVKDCEGEAFWMSGMWWPYEQTAYQLDGMARLAQFVDAPELEARVKRNLDWVFDHANPTNGDLFAALSDSPCQWPLVVLFRAAAAYAEKTGDWDRVIRAFAANYEGKRAARVKWSGRDALNLEGMLKVMEFTGDTSLLADARRMYANCGEAREFGARRHICEHGVSLAEALKLPCLLYLYTGERAYLDQAKAAVENVYAEDEQADGLYSCNEFTSGRDPRQGHETCVTADMMWTLGYFLQADGDVAMADRMERIAYNALPGSCTKDFRRHQYLSSVNQAVCGPFAQSAHFNYGESTWRQYRAAHFPQCCTGNISRSMPSFVRRMWMREKASGKPVAMLLGPSRFRGEQDGAAYEIVEETGYPFEDGVRFTLKGERPLSVTMKCRVPGWCDRPDAGTLVDLTLRTGETVSFALPVKLTLESDRNWHWIRRGPLTLSFVPPAETVKENPGDPFTALRITPKDGAWNYAFDLGEMRAAVAAAKVEFRAVGYPFEEPALSVKLPVRRIREWQTLDEGRFMPDPPLVAHPTGERAEIEFVPYATTLQRITCFADTEGRERLPVVAAYSNGELFPYDPGKPLAAQSFEPEKWGVRDYTSRYRVPPRHPDLFFDVGALFQGEKIDGKLTYLTFRVWSDRDEADATWCLSAGYRVQAFIDGHEVYSADGISEGLWMAPAWIRHPVKKGYNYMTVKLAHPEMWTMDQYPRFWGAKLEVFVPQTAVVKLPARANFIGLFGEGDDKALKYEVRADGMRF